MSLYKCDFGKGIKCQMQVPEKYPEDGDSFEVEWEGTPTDKIFPKYKQWIHSVYTDLVNKWDRSLLYGFKTGGSIEFWSYAPGERPLFLGKDFFGKE